MKQSRFQYEYRKSASKAHRKVGDLLRDSPLFNGYEIYQEYPVNKVNVDYLSGREHFDWVVKDIRLVIEVMGRQHFEPVCFGGISKEEATDKFKAQQERDIKKATAAIDAGYTYITIPDDIDPSIDYIMDQYYKNVNPRPLSHQEKQIVVDWAARYSKAKAQYKESKRYQIDKERARLYRKSQYERLKMYKKALNGNRGTP